MIFTAHIQLRAQEKAPDEVQKEKKTKITIPVTVSDREGHYISDLRKEDFAVYQNGEQKNISSFAPKEEPLSVALILDTSGSTADVLNKIKNAAKDFIDLINSKDRVMVAAFDSQVKILNSFTSDQKTLKNSIKKLQTSEHEGSALFNAVEQISQKSFAGIPGRKAIVLLSDGKDFGSAVTKSDLLKSLEESDILIYTILFSTGNGFDKLVIDSEGKIKDAKNKKPVKKKKTKKKKGYSITIPLPGDVFTEEDIKLADKAETIGAVNSLQKISDVTTGRFYLSDATNLSKTFKEIAGELGKQYQLGFYSENPIKSADVPNIVVKVARPDVVVRIGGRFGAKKL